MRNGRLLALTCATLTLGVCIGLAAKEKTGGIELLRGKPPKEAGLAALQQAEQFAGHGSWELISVARVYYLSGDRNKAQALIERALSHKPKATDFQRVGEIYADAGDKAQAESYFQRALAADANDDTGQSEIGAWYIRNGQRERGEELLAKALARNPDEVWHYIRAAEAYLDVPKGR
jgi:tetratricopeptide (TPR) repeat protein